MFITRTLVLIAVGLLLGAGLDVSAQGILERLRSGDRESVMKQLSKKKVTIDVNERDEQGLTPLMMAAVTNDSAMVELLLRHKADPNLRNNVGMTALMAAAFNTSEGVIPLLLAGGANPDVQDAKGRTALIVAAKQGVNNPVTMLLQGGANKELKDEKGNSALMVACGERHLNIMTELLDNGADPNTRDLQGRTPLMLLSLLGEDEMARLLLRHKPDISAVDYSMKTALAYAKEYKRKLVIQVLEKAGAKL